MEVENHLRKFKLLLDYIFEEKVVLDEKDIEQLLQFLENESENRGCSFVNTPRFSDYIFDAIKNIPTSSTTVSTFLIKIVTILIKNELQFSRLQLQGLTDICLQYCIVGVLESTSPPPELQLACIKLAEAQITHCSGIRLILENKIWKTILFSSIHNRPRQIENAGYKFISELILKLSQFKVESPDLVEILAYIVKPLTSSEYLELRELDQETDIILSEKIKPYLNALLVILADGANSDNSVVVNSLRSYFHIDYPLYSTLGATRITSMVILVNDIAFRYIFGLCKDQLYADKTDEFCNEIVAYYHNCIVRCIKKREIRAITDFCVKGIIFWSKFEKLNKDSLKFPITFERNGHKLELTNQLLLHLLAPIYNYIYHSNIINTKNSFKDYMEEHCPNVLDTVSDHILSTIYLMRNLFDTTDMKQVMFETAKELFRLKGSLSTSQAGIMFQSLYHALNVFIVSDEEGRLIINENPIENSYDEKLLCLLLDLIHMLFKEHNLCWYQNIEVASLQQILMNLLKQYVLNTKQIVKILDLIDVCVKKFLSPNMALLVESRQDSTLNEIGALMKTYLQHDEWEVKDSALNLLYSCIDIAYIKYPPMQKVIREDDLLFFAANLALTDPEYYVQSLSIKCLAYATRIDSIWRHMVQKVPQIFMHLVHTLRKNPEGMVRKEAVFALTGIYIHQNVSQNFEKALYKVMLNAALDDIHSEVQKATLFFWNHVIQNQLAYRGMLEGKFPSVTFSKEKKKIVTLNDEEIARLLTSILNDLSSSGCFTVILEILKEANDIKILRHAHCMGKFLIGILDAYNFQKVQEITTNATVPLQEDTIATENIQDVSMDLGYETSNEEERNKVIDEILSINQSELIMKMYTRYQKSKSNDSEENQKCYATRKLVNPNTFLETFRSTDYETVIQNKIQWNADAYSSLDDLLDEILDV